MDIKALTKQWYTAWNEGRYLDIPIADDFKHTSPYGTINGKEAYLKIIEANHGKFLDNQIEIRDEMYNSDKACVRYSVNNKDFLMEVSEWLYAKDGLIHEIIAYYNIEGEIDEGRKLEGLE